MTWKYLGVLGPCATNDRLAVLNLLLFSVSVADGYCCPRRPRDFVSQVMEESLVTPGHLDLWMKDLSPDDSRVRQDKPTYDDAIDREEERTRERET